MSENKTNLFIHKGQDFGKAVAGVTGFIGQIQDNSYHEIVIELNVSGYSNSERLALHSALEAYIANTTVGKNVVWAISIKS